MFHFAFKIHAPAIFISHKIDNTIFIIILHSPQQCNHEMSSYGDISQVKLFSIALLDTILFYGKAFSSSDSAWGTFFKILLYSLYNRLALSGNFPLASRSASNSLSAYPLPVRTEVSFSRINYAILYFRVTNSIVVKHFPPLSDTFEFFVLIQTVYHE